MLRSLGVTRLQSQGLGLLSHGRVGYLTRGVHRVLVQVSQAVLLDALLHGIKDGLAIVPPVAHELPHLQVQIRPCLHCLAVLALCTNLLGLANVLLVSLGEEDGVSGLVQQTVLVGVGLSGLAHDLVY